MDPKSEYRYTNHLANESSPYLLAHAHNPVNWYPWGDEAIERARQEHKPIFLSIGYAACHWCHVMERESFENEAIAALLNEKFISIKVDREQRPDIDHIYMTFTQAMTGHGGWPMSVFLTPDLKPFFAGTYFPPDNRQGHPGFAYILSELAGAYAENPAQVAESANAIYEEIHRHVNASREAVPVHHGILQAASSHLMKSFDHAHGGFGAAPKFPHALEISLLMRLGRRTGDLTYLLAAEKALKAMARGGIYDQVGGGFARYSTDAQWLVPHFEKMLYDNALLVPVYVEAYQITGSSFYLEVVRGTLDFLLRELRDPDGGFYSALDADSEGAEGKFYVWTPAEIRSALGVNAELVMRYYNVTDQGNFEGKNILHLTTESDRIRATFGETAFDTLLTEARARLLEVRKRRIRPSTDDKILTSWNGLVLSALARGYQVTGDRQYLEAAISNAEFIHNELYMNGKLTHAYRQGVHSEGEFLEDYAYYVQGLIDLYESDRADSNGRWLELAISLADRATRFADESGVFYLRPDHQPDLIFRPREESDGSTPAPGSIMIHSLFRLHRHTGKTELLQSAEAGMRALSGQLARYPSAMTAALFAADFQLSDKVEIVIIGGDQTQKEMLTDVYRRYLPNRTIAISSRGQGSGPLFQGRSAQDGKARAYVCRNSVCDLPALTLDQFRERLSKV